MPRVFRICLFVGTGLLISGCASKVLKYEKAEQLKEIKEFDQAVQIVAPDEPVAILKEKATETQELKPARQEAPSSKTLKKSKKKNKKKEGGQRQPPLESDTGFQGRRPLVDPFRVGEKIVHHVSYFKMKAGTLSLEVKPYAQVNGKKSYNFQIGISTSPLFSSFYSVDDKVTTLMDFESLVPNVFTLHVKESSQLREARAFFDIAKNHATYWEKKVTEKNGEEQKKQEWDILDYSQNVFSSAFYLRVFKWDVGTVNAFRVADDGENLVFKGKAVRKEKISTEAGDFDAVVVRPEIILKDQFKPVGDIFIWLSDDDRKFILRLESKIKIGTLVSEVTELNKGQEVP